MRFGHQSPSLLKSNFPFSPFGFARRRMLSFFLGFDKSSLSSFFLREMVDPHPLFFPKCQVEVDSSSFLEQPPSSPPSMNSSPLRVKRKNFFPPFLPPLTRREDINPSQSSSRNWESSLFIERRTRLPLGESCPFPFPEREALGVPISPPKGGLPAAKKALCLKAFF